MTSVRMIKEEPELCIMDDPYVSEICGWKIGPMDCHAIEKNKETMQDTRAMEATIQQENETSNANVDAETRNSRENNSKPFECSTCGRKFSQKAYLVPHFRVHTGEKPYPCKHCTASFSRIDSLGKHNRSRHRSLHGVCPTRHRPSKGGFISDCSVCNKTFNKLTDYEQHMSKEHDIKPYECSTCGMKFSRKAYLVPHFRVHTGEKPYSCKHCTASFSRASDFKKHNRSHQGISLFKCELCDSRFTRAFSLRYHLACHMGEKPYFCKICGIPFKLYNHYRYHSKTHCKNTFECVFCKRKFKSRDSTAKHVRTCR